MIGRDMNENWTNAELERVADAECMVAYSFEGCLLTYKYGNEVTAETEWSYADESDSVVALAERFDKLATRFNADAFDGPSPARMLAMLQNRARRILAARRLASLAVAEHAST